MTATLLAMAMLSGCAGGALVVLAPAWRYRRRDILAAVALPSRTVVVRVVGCAPVPRRLGP